MHAPPRSDTHAGLSFVVLGRPSDAKTDNVRRQIRSHVTLTQHRAARERRAGTFHLYEAVDARVGKATRHTKTRRAPRQANSRANRTLTSIAPDADCSRAGSRLVVPHDKCDQLRAREFANGKALTFKHVPGREVTPCTELTAPGTVLEQSFSQGVMAFRTFALDDAANILGTSLHHLRLDISSVLACYQNIALVQVRDFEARFAPDVVEGVAYERFFRFIFADPMVLTIAILLTIRHMLTSRERPVQPKDLDHVFHLRALMIRKVNEALDDPARSCSDHMLVAVLLFAAHELHYVSVQGFHVHMNGLVHMINLRGGMSKIGENDPYLERMLIWHDANASAQIGCAPYCTRVKKPSKIGQPTPDTDMFRMCGPYQRR